MLLRSIAFFFVITFSALAQSATILVWGDSLSAGYQLRSGQEWPVLLQTRLEEKGFPHTVINGSVSGETSSGGRSRLPGALEEHEPDLFILELGANDGLRGLDAGLLTKNLEAMITAAQQAGAKVLLVGMEMPPNYGPRYTQQFRDAFSDVAERTEVELVPFMLERFATDRDYFLSDGIHPTAEAQPLILDTIWAKLEPMLEKTTQAAR